MNLRLTLAVWTVVALAAGGCASPPALEDLVIDDPGGDWRLVLDERVTNELLDDIGAISGQTLTFDAEEPAWIRSWESERGSVTIVLIETGPLRRAVVPAMASELAARGYDVVPAIDGLPDAIVVDQSDGEDTATGLLVPHEAYMAGFTFEGDADAADGIRRIVRQQLDALPEYDPTDEYRPWMIGIFGSVFLVALWFALRTGRRTAPTQNIDGGGYLAP